MPPLLDVSDEVRAEIGDAEAERLLAGENAPGPYDCTSCRTPGDTNQERTSTVLFVGEETAVLAFAHATCIPSQVVPVSEEQVRSAVRSINGDAAMAAGAPAAPSVPAQGGGQDVPRQAVLGITCGLVLCQGSLYPALVIEPTGPVGRPGSTADDEFLLLLHEEGFHPVLGLETAPPRLPGWSVLLAMGKLHAVLQGGTNSRNSTAWWQAHQPLSVSDGWRSAANRTNEVFVYAAPVGTIGRQPREDLMRDALDRAAARGLLVGGVMPLAGT
ncbi:hypothetical protein POF50_020390 [Streptomyces sp. SL13]|uniref:Uncharacterized protein n=1 Tax=Streptantibioticus silvisoli TaxID=2705255 RepID=A0AA90HBD9_9ACTN|nr:hypothetical protein [Streptantibioticus silvisoli]MDI5966320.1 hypothetical protein [Streptantibioticus silvisoli]MDI5971662.1 hypothetical protein [Streptantibioticus silvisoli]